MKAHAPYTEADWQADRARVKAGERLSCPDCDDSADYWPRVGTEGEPTEWHYRACKMCGFWQQADGTPAYRCWKSVHECQHQLDSSETTVYCLFCEKTYPADTPGGSLVTHHCGKYLEPEEDGYMCLTCGRWQGRETAVLWPRKGSG